MAQSSRLRSIIADGLARRSISTPRDLKEALHNAGCMVSPQTCWNWMNDKAGIAREHMPAVAEVLGVSLADLVLASADVGDDTALAV